MNAETVIESLAAEDLKAIFRYLNESSSGTPEDLRERLRKRSKALSWKFLLKGVPKEGLQRICAAGNLRSDLSKDEMIDQIVASMPKSPSNKGLLRDLGSPWMRWTAPGQRGRR